jgi:acetyltransferase-like isoleucine patch superfamily enzyme
VLSRIINLYYRFLYRHWLDSRIRLSSSSFIHNAATFIVGDSPKANITVSDNVYIGRFANIHTNSSISIGANSVISDYVYISTLSHGFNPENGPIMQQASYDKGPVVLGENVFLGFGVKVMPNITLGDWCIIGAGSVVTKSFPSYVMVAGNPAKVIRHYDHVSKTWVLHECD